jgi:tetratricopeptide (TPR) repeat protein
LGHFKYIFFLIICSSVFLHAQVFPDAKVDSLLKDGIENIINQRYDFAKKDFIILDKNFPKLPVGKIYIAAVEIAKSYDLAIPFKTEFINKNLDEAKEMSEALIDSDEDNIWNNYFLALADGYKAYFDALTGDWLSAFGTGVTSVNLFEHCLKVDSTFYEALIATGTYKYWKSRKMEFLNWIPFVSDEREEGIKLLEKAVNNSSYNSYLAINSLIWIYIDRHEFNKAIKIAQSASLHYPNSRFFKYGLARAYEDVDKQKAIQIYYEILNSFTGEEKLNHCNEIILKHIIAQQYYRLGDNKSALALCNEILNIKNLTDYELDKLGDRLDRVKSLKRELSNP